MTALPLEATQRSGSPCYESVCWGWPQVAALCDHSAQAQGAEEALQGATDESLAGLELEPGPCGWSL